MAKKRISQSGSPIVNTTKQLKKTVESLRKKGKKNMVIIIQNNNNYSFT